jgi:hypothetical protein
MPVGYGGLSGLLAPPPETAARGERPHRRTLAVPTYARPDLGSFLAHLPEILAGLFDDAKLSFAHGALRGYEARAGDLGPTVRVAATGRRATADGTADGWGLISLARWRLDLGVTEAVVVLQGLVALDDCAPVPAPAGDAA